jgi:hypothetical protein
MAKPSEFNSVIFSQLLLKLLDQGSRSPRTMRLTAMHVAGLWLKFPAVTKYYIEELYLLSIHGGGMR